MGAGGHGVFVLGQMLGKSLNCCGGGGAAGGRVRNWVLEGQAKVRSTGGTSRAQALPCVMSPGPPAPSVHSTEEHAEAGEVK